MNATITVRPKRTEQGNPIINMGQGAYFKSTCTDAIFQISDDQSREGRVTVHAMRNGNTEYWSDGSCGIPVELVEATFEIKS